MREVVTNTSPLLYLHQLGKIELLGVIYSKVLVPRSVVEELEAGRAGGHDVPRVDDVPWAQIVASSTVALLAMATDLGSGESEALLRAKASGHISQIAPRVVRLTELGFHLSSQTRDAVLKLANET